MTEVYKGVKFRTLFEGAHFEYSEERNKIIQELSKLKEKGLLDRNNGNISVRAGKGMVITPTGKSMDDIVESDLVYVKGTNESAKLVMAVGTKQPSSESIMHWLIYENYPKVGAVLHFHDTTLLKRNDEFAETEVFHHYGTLELAHEVLKTLKKSKFIIIKDHGALAIGKDLEACHKLLEKAKKSKTH
jgi:L-fuculose-phosphate aldolase